MSWNCKSEAPKVSIKVDVNLTLQTTQVLHYLGETCMSRHIVTSEEALPSRRQSDWIGCEIMHGLNRDSRKWPIPAELADKKRTRAQLEATGKRIFPIPVARRPFLSDPVSSRSRHGGSDAVTPELRSGVGGMHSDVRHAREDVRERLAEELESEIIPRLLLVHASIPKAVFGNETLAAFEKSFQARELARTAVESDASAVIDCINELIISGTPLETILIDILAGAARNMGRQWERDELDFVQVTIGVSHLQQAFRHLLIENPTAFTKGSSAGHSAVFVAAGGEQHSFGLIIIEEVFRSRGWSVRSSTEFDYAQVIELVTQEPIDLVGFSLACESRLDQVTEQINTLRSASLSPDLVIIVGGNVFLDNPGLWKEIGADGSAPDAIEALLVGEKLVRARKLANQSSA